MSIFVISFKEYERVVEWISKLELIRGTLDGPYVDSRHIVTYELYLENDDDIILFKLTFPYIREYFGNTGKVEGSDVD